jgi:hypothetical protein
MKIFRFLNLFVIVTSLVLVNNSCTIGPSGKWSVGYNLKGSAIPAGTKTAYIQYFQNRAAIVQPQLAQRLTEKLKDKIQSHTNLKIVTKPTDGDANFEGVITEYKSEPKQVSGGDEVTASLNRLDVVLKVKYYNTKDGEWDFDTNISRYIEYPASQSLQSVEGEKLDELVDLLVDDIFNKAFVNW